MLDLSTHYMMNGQVSKKFIIVFFLFIPIQSLILVDILLGQKNQEIHIKPLCLCSLSQKMIIMIKIKKLCNNYENDYKLIMMKSAIKT